LKLNYIWIFTCGIEGSSLSTSKQYKRWVFHNGMVWMLVHPSSQSPSHQANIYYKHLTCWDSLLVGLLTMPSFIDLCVMHSTLLSTFNACGQLVFSCLMIKWLFTRVNSNPTHWYSTIHGQVMNVSMHVPLKTILFWGWKITKTNITIKVNIMWQFFFKK
jgi:hypothetical protein